MYNLGQATSAGTLNTVQVSTRSFSSIKCTKIFENRSLEARRPLRSSALRVRAELDEPIVRIGTRGSPLALAPI